MSHALEHIREKLKRADEHIVQLKREVDAFLDEESNRTIIDYDAQAAEAFDDFHRSRTVPPRISVLTGDVLYQLRTSLDHLACALILRDGGTLTDKSQFPIFRFKPDPSKKDEVRRYEGQIKGVTRPDVLAAIETYQPYTRGDRRGGHWLAILKDLSNTDKHRALVLHAMHVEPRVTATIEIPDEGMVLEIDSRDTGAPLPESVTDADGHAVEVVNMQRSRTAAITFAQWGDTGVTVWVTDGLEKLLQAISDTVNDFSRFLT